jgi:hypothetical protein
MMASKNRCTKYISASLVVHFPEEEGIQCKLCPCLETYARRQCRLTGEYLADGYLIGGLCPLNLITEEAEDVSTFART